MRNLSASPPLRNVYFLEKKQKKTNREKEDINNTKISQNENIKRSLVHSGTLPARQLCNMHTHTHTHTLKERLTTHDTKDGIIS